MGCDIHGWVEKKVGEKWIAIDRLKDDSRNYERFARLADVRNYTDVQYPGPKGIPEDVSETAGYDIEQTGTDGHSHSYMPIKEAVEIFNDTAEEKSEFPEFTFFDLDGYDEDLGDYRLVFWFDS